MIDQFATRLLVICVLTDDCNQTCKYCSENAGLGNTKMLPYEMVDNLLKDIYEVSKEAIISFIGGEVTIWPRFYELLGEEILKSFNINHYIPTLLHYPKKMFLILRLPIFLKSELA